MITKLPNELFNIVAWKDVSIMLNGPNKGSSLLELNGTEIGSKVCEKNRNQ